MNYGDMQNRVYNLLGVGDSTNAGITSTEVKDTINAVLPDITVEVECLLTFSEYTCVASTQRYSLPEHYLTVKQLIIERSSDNWRPLILLNLNRWEQTAGYSSASEGIPEYYKIERGAVAIDDTTKLPGDIWLYPVPDDTYTFRLYYYQHPTNLTNDTDISELPKHLHLAVCYAAAEILAIKRKDYELARFLNGKYQLAIDKAKMAENRPQRVHHDYAPDVMGYTELD